MKKTVVLGLGAAVASFIVSMAYGMSGIGKQLYMNTPQLWKPMDSQLILNRLIFDLIFGFIFAFVFIKFAGAIKERGISKGLSFGFYMFLISSIPGILLTYVFMPVPERLLVIWAVQGFIQFLAMGAVAANLDEKVK